MGIIRIGILGGFRKKTGTVVGAQWRNKDVIRAIPRLSTKPPTQLQIDQQLKFGLVTTLLSEISELIDIGFYLPGDEATPMNKAVSYHLKGAIAGVSPNFSLDFEALKYSLGKLELPNTVTATGTNPNEISFAWDSIVNEGKHIEPTDRATFLIYNVNKQKFLQVIDVVDRSAGEYVMTLPAQFAGDTLHTYISFSSGSIRRKKSDSMFIATVALPI
jgi:hypothetical protein